MQREHEDQELRTLPRVSRSDVDSALAVELHQASSDLCLPEADKMPLANPVTSLVAVCLKNHEPAFEVAQRNSLRQNN